VSRRIQIDDPGGLRIFGTIKQFEPHMACVPAEEHEIDPAGPFPRP